MLDSYFGDEVMSHTPSSVRIMIQTPVTVVDQWDNFQGEEVHFLIDSDLSSQVVNKK